MWDGSLLFISCDTVKGKDGRYRSVPDTLQLYRIDRDGQPLSLPFPVVGIYPSSVSVDQPSRCVAILDRFSLLDQGTVCVYRETSTGWTSHFVKPGKSVQFIALTPTLEVVCTGDDHTLFMVSQTGHTLWQTPLPVGDYVSRVAIDRAGQHIIVSNPNNNKVTVYNLQGHLLYTFPITEHIKTLSAVCTDSVGRVMVADWDTKTVHLYTIDGQYIQQVVK